MVAGSGVHHSYKAEVTTGQEGVTTRAGSWLITFHPYTGSREREQAARQGYRGWAIPTDESAGLRLLSVP